MVFINQKLFLIINNGSTEITSSNEDCHDDAMKDKICLDVHNRNGRNQQKLLSHTGDIENHLVKTDATRSKVKVVAGV